MSDQANRNLSRRQFLQQGAATAGAAAALSTAAAAAQDKKSIRIGVIGAGPRGRWHITNLLRNHPDVTITAICDIQPDRLKQATDMVQKARGTTPAAWLPEAISRTVGARSTSTQW